MYCSTLELQNWQKTFQKKTNDIPSILKQSTELLKISILQPIQYSSNLRNQDNDLSLDFLCQFCNTNVVEHI